MNTGPRPRYQMVKDYILERVDSGAWKPDDRVPSETDLVKLVGVSRMTANRAIRELTAEGWLTRIPGVGTFVAAPKAQGTLLEITSIAAEIAARGHRHAAKLVVLERETASAATARLLDLAPGQEVFHILLVHYEDGQPVQIEDRHVNPRVAPDFMAQDFTRLTPSEYLLALLPVTEIEHQIQARLPSAEEAELLAMEPTQPCLVLDRRSWSGEAVVTRVRLTHPGSRATLGGRTRVDAAAASLIA